MRYGGKVAVYTIAKNEEEHAKRWATSTQDADLRLVGDTGSADNTVHTLKLHGVQVVRGISVNPFRFDAARNCVLSLLPADIDWCIVLDMDEVLAEGWRDQLDDLGTRKRTLYHWRPGPETEAQLLQQRVISSLSTHGEEPYVFWDDRRIHRREGYAWRYPCHEELYAYGGAEDELVDSAIQIIHLPDPTKSRSQYLDLLAPAARNEYPHSSRMQFYYARELCFRGMYDEAVDYFRLAAQKQLMI